MGAEEKAAFVRAKLVGLRLFGWPVCPGDALEIVPEPENQHDANALQVLVWTGARWSLPGTWTATRLLSLKANAS